MKTLMILLALVTVLLSSACDGDSPYNPDVLTDTDSDSDSDGDSDSDSDSDTDSDTDADTDDGGPDSSTDTDTDTDTDSDTDTDTDTGPPACPTNVHVGNVWADYGWQLNALSSVTRIEGFLVINVQDASITDLSQLSCLEEVSQHFWIWTTYGLQSLDGLENFGSTSEFIVAFNDDLTDISALNSFSDAGTRFEIRDNDSLLQCDAIQLKDQLLADGWTGNICVHSNQPDACGTVVTGC